ncbi:hypothetical protein ACIGG5_33895 [Streptomyces sp. NPDC085463]|uniref:hypothetical protein n=1 Tax=Streptomyces sp. NPDC085463 TaxID=3365724 RepID=UPI0037D845BE
MHRATLRSGFKATAVFVTASFALGSAAPLAVAAENRSRQSDVTREIIMPLANAVEIPEITERGLDARLESLGEDRSPNALAYTFYPDDTRARQEFIYQVTSSPLARGFWSSTWKYTKCAAAVAAAFVPAGKAYAAIKALGGVARTVKLLWGAGKLSDFRRIAGGAAAQILGISGIQSYCF